MADVSVLQKLLGSILTFGSVNIQPFRVVIDGYLGSHRSFTTENITDKKEQSKTDG